LQNDCRVQRSEERLALKLNMIFGKKLLAFLIEEINVLKRQSKPEKMQATRR
jgi:hypothetical protein